VNLRDCPLGCALRLDAMCLAAADELRLRELGLREGAVVSVVQRAGFGGRVVACGYQRFALDGVTAAALTGQAVAANDTDSEPAGVASVRSGRAVERVAEPIPA
jgi:ferrous iron transport protein A